MAVVCSRCGAKPPIAATMSGTATEGWICPSCAALLAKEAQEALSRLKEIASNIVLTTTNGIDGYTVTRYLGIESVEFIIGTGAFSEVSTDFQDLLGQRSSAFEKKLRVAKKAAFDSFTLLAAERGANAIIGIDIDYTEFSGNRIGLVVNGTFVVIAPLGA